MMGDTWVGRGFLLNGLSYTAIHDWANDRPILIFSNTSLEIDAMYKTNGCSMTTDDKVHGSFRCFFAGGKHVLTSRSPGLFWVSGLYMSLLPTTSDVSPESQTQRNLTSRVGQTNWAPTSRPDQSTDGLRILFGSVIRRQLTAWHNQSVPNPTRQGSKVTP